MRPAEAIRICLAKTFVIRGRATRSEFWWFAAPWFLATSFLLLLGSGYVAAGSQKLLILAFLAVNTPMLTAAVRRLTDSGSIERHAGYVGYGFAALLVGPGLFVIWNNIAQSDPQSWMVPVMIVATIAGLITLTYFLSTPSKSKSTLEVSK